MHLKNSRRSRAMIAAHALWVVVLCACVHDQQLVVARLDAARSDAHSSDGMVAADKAIAWSEAVTAALNAHVATPEDGDLEDALYVLRVATARAEDQERAPLTESRGHLLAAAGRLEQAEAAFVEAVNLRPGRANLEPLLAFAQKRGDSLRVRGLCVSGATVVSVAELPDLLKLCAKASGDSEATMQAWWLAADRQRLQTGNELPTDGAANACALRCRSSLYRAVASCPADERCVTLASRALDVCGETCRTAAGPASFP